MKKILYIGLIAITALACKNTEKEVKEETMATTNVEIEEVVDGEWQVLFDGKNFDNFKGYLSEGMYPEWTIEDGAMAFTPGTSGGKNIITKKEYTNFILSLEWKIAEGGNSGIFYGVHEDAAFSEAYQTGPEIQVLDDERHPDANRGGKTHRAGALYDMIAPKDGVVNPAGEWNEVILEINHDKNLGRVTMNGTELYVFPTHGDKWKGMIAKSKFKDWKGFGDYKTGHIGLQDHGDKVWYRNIKIKELN
tara:strand:+ start:19836 stop:20582 length:747 start_codon:yes stop_codon:yes gene_type:complete